MRTFRSTLNTLMFGFLLLGATSLTQSCNRFDNIGYGNATNLATALTDLMAKATGKYDNNTEAISKVKDGLTKAVSHAAGRKNNKEIATAWQTLQDDLVTPFLDRWKDKGMLDKDYVKEATAQVSKSLEAIKKAELARKK